MSRPPLGVALVGYGFMGAAHSQAWRVAPRFFELPVEPRMSVIVGRDRSRLRQSDSDGRRPRQTGGG
jgi:predicted dehydrogenase